MHCITPEWSGPSIPSLARSLVLYLYSMIRVGGLKISPHLETFIDPGTNIVVRVEDWLTLELVIEANISMRDMT